MNKNENSINWFEIPALSMQKSKLFYETIFDVTMETSMMDDTEMAFFPWNPGNRLANGALAKSPNHSPGVHGSVIYLNANPNLRTVVDKINTAGGRVTIPEMDVGEHGFTAFFIDPAGNNIGLHADSL